MQGDQGVKLTNGLVTHRTMDGMHQGQNTQAEGVQNNAGAKAGISATSFQPRNRSQSRTRTGLPEGAVGAVQVQKGPLEGDLNGQKRATKQVQERAPKQAVTCEAPAPPDISDHGDFPHLKALDKGKGPMYIEGEPHEGASRPSHSTSDHSLTINHHPPKKFPKKPERRDEGSQGSLASFKEFSKGMASESELEEEATSSKKPRKKKAKKPTKSQRKKINAAKKKEEEEAREREEAEKGEGAEKATST